MVKWEYKIKIVTANYVRATEEHPDGEYLVSELNKLGTEGWELVCSTSFVDMAILYFKRASGDRGVSHGR